MTTSEPSVRIQALAYLMTVISDHGDYAVPVGGSPDWYNEQQVLTNRGGHALMALGVTRDEMNEALEFGFPVSPEEKAAAIAAMRAMGIPEADIALIADK